MLTVVEVSFVALTDGRCPIEGSSFRPIKTLCQLVKTIGIRKSPSALLIEARTAILMSEVPEAADNPRVDPTLPLVYSWVKRTREVLLEYAESLPPEVYIFEHPDFAYGSIRNIQAHVANCYLSWVGRYGLGLERYHDKFEASSLEDVQAVRAKFGEVDLVVEQACASFTQPDEVFELVRPGRDRLQVTQRWLIMHPITHEFHHKGQLLALGRVLGHPLPAGGDTDLVLP